MLWELEEGFGRCADRGGAPLSRWYLNTHLRMEGLSANEL